MSQLTACTVYMHVPKGEHLITKVNIKGAPNNHREQMLELVEENTNTKIFGVWRVRTRNWYLTERFRNRKGKEENTIWEAPNYYTEEGTEKTVQKMEAFLKNQGYFNASVKAKVKFKGLQKKKAEINYIINRKKAYVINDVDRNIEDFDIYNIIESDKSKSLIKKGKIFSSSTLVSERERILNLLKDKGYYDFSREYVYFDLDSSLNKYKIDVRIGLKNPDLYQRHKVYKFNTITFLEKDTAENDTTNTILAKGVYRKGNGNKYIDDLLLKSITIGSGQVYSQQKMQETLRNLRKIQMYQYADVYFTKSNLDQDTALMDVLFVLSPYQRIQIQLQSEAISSEQNLVGGTNVGRLYGLAGSIGYKDVNFLHRGIQMDTRIRASNELSLVNANIIPNNELSFNNSYYFAKPFLASFMPTYMRNLVSQSTLSIKGFWDSNPDFARYTANVGAGYIIEIGRFKHYLLPIDFNLVSTNVRSESFQNLLNEAGNLHFKNLFDNHTIAGSRWGLYYTNKVLGDRKNYIEFTANMIEMAGNAFYIASTVLGTPVEGQLETTYKNTLFNMHFFQYVKGDYDFRFHQKTFWNNEFVYRAYVGMIYPFGNTPEAVPFEKRYYTGGANSIRGWGLRQLGPGSYKEADNENNYVYYHSGDIKLEANAEYRFSVSSLLKLALFVDAGNIWNLPQNSFQVPGGDFQFDRFYNEFAVAGGLGLRFDFTYFVFRTDFGMPFRDPSAPGTGKEKWFPDQIYKSGVYGDMLRLNFGIGYPF